VGGIRATEADPPSAPHAVQDFVRAYTEEGRLRGFRCPECGLRTATWGLACPRCGHTGLEETELASRGRIAAFTVLYVPGDEFLNDAPYAYVVVDLDGGGRVTGWMPSVRSPEELAIGARVRFEPGYKPGVQFVRDDAPASG
jgi:uncharacterized OB-fold protein